MTLLQRPITSHLVKGKTMFHAVLVGINTSIQYHAMGADLNGCVPDADHWNAEIANLPVTSHIVTLKDDAANKAAILSAIQECAAAATANDEFLLMVSSHGTTKNGEHYLCTAEFDWTPDTGISASELVKALKAFKCPVGVWIDACMDPIYGAVEKGLRTERAVKPRLFPGTEFHAGKVRAIGDAIDESTLPLACITATGPNGFAGDGLDGGLFTTAGLAALASTPNLTADQIVAQIAPVLASEGQDENSLPVAVGANTSNPFLL